MTHEQKQLVVLVALLAGYSLLALATYLLFPLGELVPHGVVSPVLEDVPPWQLGLTNAAIVLVLYGSVGLLGWWFARRLGLPGVFREGAGWRAWVRGPMVAGCLLGVVVTVVDRLFAGSQGGKGFPHPPFPLSLVASTTAAIGEEILFRALAVGAIGYLLSRLFRGRYRTLIGLWVANLVAAIGFGAAHLPALVALTGVSRVTELPARAVAEVFVLNALVGLVAGDRYMRDGLVAAVGIHFWTDIIWHVLWPALGIGG